MEIFHSVIRDEQIRYLYFYIDGLGKMHLTIYNLLQNMALFQSFKKFGYISRFIIILKCNVLCCSVSPFLKTFHFKDSLRNGAILAEKGFHDVNLKLEMIWLGLL